MRERGYYYEHVDGPVVFKSEYVVETGGGPHEYFSGPFVRRWWFEPGKARQSGDTNAG